ncbi:MAG: metallophosphoesterase [Ignavibacteriales bacterium]|nr:metallophosphoesterase [Ignavibacteriales bacterium]
MKNFFIVLFIFSTTAFSQKEKLNFLVKPYVQNTSATSITILWETNPASKGEVQFGKAELDKNSPTLDQKIIQDSFSTMHVIELKNLEPGKQYFYKALSCTENGDTLIYNILPIATFPYVEQPFTFAVFSDSQQQEDTLAWNKISNMALMERPNFGLIVGDLVERGEDINMWRNQFLSKAHEFMKSIPLFPVMGNHDNNDPNYFKYMKSRSEKSYYTFTYCNAQFFIIDSNLELEPGSEQYNWLEEELAKSKTDWKIAAHHHPAYSSDYDDYGNSETSLRLKGDPVILPLIPLYEKYNVDVVFSGHIHSYERTWQIANDKVDDDGVVYIQTGGAGGNLEKSAVMRSWFTAKVKSAHNFCLVSVNGNQLYFCAIDYSGNLFDQIKLKKEADKLLTLSTPVIRAHNNKFIDEINVTIEDYNKNAEARFTFDGGEPSINSQLYKGQIRINESCILKVSSFVGNLKSKTSKMFFEKIEGQNGYAVNPTNNGLNYKYYEGTNWLNLPDFEKTKEIKSGAVGNISITEIKEREDQFAITYGGFIRVDDNDVYTFYVRSDDGTKLYIDDQLVVDNNGSHSARTKYGSIALLAGYHKFYLEYFDNVEGEELKVMFKSSKYERREIKNNELFR